MKKLLGCMAFFIGLASLNAQSISDNAIGLRLGGGNGYGAEISYQRGLSEENRLEFNLGFRNDNDFDGFKLAGLYQWVWNLDGNFNWYAGAGGGLGSYDVEIPGIFNDSETFIFAAGNVGIEYDFDIPLLLSLDVRPELGFGNFNDDFDFDIALGIRYQF